MATENIEASDLKEEEALAKLKDIFVALGEEGLRTSGVIKEGDKITGLNIEAYQVTKSTKGRDRELLLYSFVIENSSGEKKGTYGNSLWFEDYKIHGLRENQLPEIRALLDDLKFEEEIKKLPKRVVITKMRKENREKIKKNCSDSDKK